MNIIKDTDTEKRQSIRVKDRILMGFKEISQQEYEERISEYMEGLSDPWIETSHPSLRKSTKNHMKRLRDRDPDLAAILEILDQKLNLLLGILGSEDTSLSPEYRARLYKVDLSAKGIGFRSQEHLAPGRLLSFYIGLLPEHYYFNCFGKVVRSRKEESGHFIAVEFVWITEDDQEKLIEHIFSRQVLQLRMRR
ncbi:MAG: hypothetical protein DSZ23_05915, partial [Thermodesulfatator sp.]